MLKRANKLTALVAAAATVASTITMVPAFATERLGTQDGEFTQAFSYDEGKFIYNGYRTDDDDSAIYFNDGENEDEVEDYDDYDFDEAEKYGTKYVTVEDDGDHYLLDLSTGEIDDGESIEDKADNVRSRLKTNLKKASRYEIFKDSKEDIEEEDCSRILKNKYGEVWYKYEVAGDEDAEDYMAEGNKYIGVVNEDNKYLDLSYVANISVYSPSKEKTVKFDKFGDSEELDKEGNEATLKLVDTKIIDQDEDYLYAITTVKLDGEAVEKPSEEENKDKASETQTVQTLAADADTGTLEISEETPEGENQGSAQEEQGAAQGENQGAAQEEQGAAQEEQGAAQGEQGAAQEENQGAADKTGYKYFFQKISKAQGDKKEGAYTPKSVDSYEINIAETYNDDDMDDAAEELEKVLYQDEDEEPDVGSVINVKVSDGMIHVAVLDETDKAKVYQLKFKKSKVDTDEKEKVDAYVVLKDGDTDETIVDIDEDSKPYSVDVDGNLWILGKGKIYKYDGDEFNELYTCDRSINNLDVYNEDNLIAWEKDDEVFAVLQGGKGSTDPGTNPDDPIVTSDKRGWDKNADGTWSFYDANGAQIKASWINDGGVWYYLKDDGIMATGWLQEGGNWYYLNQSGAMQTGWLNDNGTWYFLQPSGAMAYGWLQDTDGRWYYLSMTSGAMLTNTTIDGYVLGANGAWIQ